MSRDDDSDDFQSDESEIDDFGTQSQWKLTQWFRKMEEETEIEMQDHDHISALQFSDDGDYLATGDFSGNVVVLYNDGQGKNGAPAHFSFFTEFQSHYLDHSFAKAQELMPKITDLKFGPRMNDSVYLLVTSETEIKLWRIAPQQQYTIVDWNIPVEPMEDRAMLHDTHRQHQFRTRPLVPDKRKPIIKKLKVPRRALEEVETVPILRKLYSSDVHTTGIVGLDVTSDKLTFLSADCISVNLWDLSVTDKSYKIVDIEPDGEEYTEIISSVHAHPTESNRFLYTTSSGYVRTCDLRIKSIVDDAEQTLSHRSPDQSDFEDADQNLWEVEELSSSVSDAKFSKGGKFIISRDYMSIRIWDVTKSDKPLETIYVHEYLRDSLVDLKEANYMFDAFKLGLSPRGDVVTGTYGNYFHILDFAARRDTFIQAGTPTHKVCRLAGLRNMMTGPLEVSHERKRGGLGLIQSTPSQRSGFGEVIDYPHNLSVDRLDFSSKVLNCAWHSKTNTVALTGENNVFVYGKFRKRS